MGIYNLLFIEHADPITNEKRDLVLQFKQGKCDLIEYRIGDELGWGGLDYGEPGKKKVVVEGISESVPYGHELERWLIFIENNVITRTELDDGRYNFANPSDYGIVLEE